MPTLTKPIATPVAEAERALVDAQGADAEARDALARLLADDEAGDPWRRPSGRELQDARHRAQVAGRARKAAEDALVAARARVQREQDEARRQQRQAAVRRYLDALDRAAAAWTEVAATGPVVGLGPAVASPEGVAWFTAWVDRNVP